MAFQFLAAMKSASRGLKKLMRPLWEKSIKPEAGGNKQRTRVETH
jgi:hypothetical protein